MRTTRPWGALLLLALLPACGDDDPARPVPPQGTVVDESGGLVQSEDGLAELLLPAGALESATDVVLQPAEAGEEGNDPLMVVGTAYRLLPDGLQLQDRARLRLRYDPDHLPDGVTQDRLRIRERDRDQDRWRDTENHRLREQERIVEADIAAFGVYAVVAVAEGTYVGADGGLVASQDGNAEVELPAGALDGWTDVSLVASDDTFGGDPLYVAGTAYRLEPDGLQLQDRARLRLRYDPDHLPDGLEHDRLRIRQRDRDQERWRDTENHRLREQERIVEADIQMLGLYAVVIHAVGTLVGPEGGTAVSADGEASLEIPAGALDGWVDITFTRVPDTTFTDDPGYIPGTGWDVGPDQLRLQERARLRLLYDPAHVPAHDRDRLRIRERDRDRDRWQATDENQLREQEHTMVAEVERLGRFAVVLADPPTLVGPAGGTVTSADGDLELVVPPGALTTMVAIFVEPAGDASLAEDPAYVAGTAWSLGPHGLALREQATLRIRFDPDCVGDQDRDRLRIRERDRDDDGDGWRETTRNRLHRQEHVVEAEIDRLGVYAVVLED